MQMIKLESVNCWADEIGVFPCDEKGQPISEDNRLYENMPADWFQNLSVEDKEIVNNLINKNKEQ